VSAHARVVLWRHGRTAWNLEGRFQGTTDIALDEVGIAQAERAARDLATLQPDVVVSSPLGRALATAEVLAVLVGTKVLVDDDLRETFAGTWQGLTRAEINAIDPKTFASWIGGEDVRPGGGESRSEVAERVAAAVERHAALLRPGGTLVVVTHGGATRAGIGKILDLPVDHWASLGGLVNCAWSVLERMEPGVGRRWRLTEHNARSLPEDVVGDEA
jgi:broad specificity phosphatase PhoE